MSLVIYTNKAIIFTTIINIESSSRDNFVKINCIRNDGRFIEYNIKDNGTYSPPLIDRLREQIRVNNNINNHNPIHQLSSLPTIFIDGSSSVSITEQYRDSTGNIVINTLV